MYEVAKYLGWHVMVDASGAIGFCAFRVFRPSLNLSERKVES